MTCRFYAGESRLFGFLTVDSFLSSIFDINVVIANGSCAASDMLISATNVDSEELRFLSVNNLRYPMFVMLEQLSRHLSDDRAITDPSIISPIKKYQKGSELKLGAFCLRADKLTDF
jgi:hypothetical protein